MAKSEHSSKLINGLKFVSLSKAEYCSIANNLITAFTDDICMGFFIEENLNVHAHIKKLQQSLLKAIGQTTITQLELTKLHVNSGELQVYINCNAQIEHAKPDEKKIELNENFVKAIHTLLPLVSLHGNHISEKTMLANKQSLFATNRFIIVEYYHGIELPYLNISKKFCDLIIKAKKDAKYLGFSENSVTVYFVDDSWIMGRISKEEWFNPYSVIESKGNFQPISDEFKAALRSVPGFSDTGLAYCAKGCLQSHPDGKDGAFYPVPGLPEGAKYGVKDLAFLYKNGNEICFDNPKVLYFYGENLRGAISSRME